MRHRGLELIKQDDLDEVIARCPPDQFIIWTGHRAGAQRGSMRSRSLTCITEVGEPVPLRTILRRAALFTDAVGFDPRAVRAAIRSHQSAQPAVYLLVRRTSARDFVAAADLPFPAGVGRPVAAGETLLTRSGERLFQAAHPDAEIEAPPLRRAAL